MSSIFVIAFPQPQHNVLAPNRLLNWKPATNLSGPVTPQEAKVANPHFVARFQQPKFSRLPYTITPNDIQFIFVPETNINYVAKFQPVTFTLLQSLRQSPNTDYVITPNLPETNAHFIGRFTAPQFFRQPITFSPSDLPIATYSNPHFVGKFTPQTYFLRPVTSYSRDPLPFETNTHFVGKFAPVAHRLLQSLRQSPNTDYIRSVFPTETNVHFIGRFRPVEFRRLSYNTPATDQPPPPVLTVAVSQVRGTRAVVVVH